MESKPETGYAGRVLVVDDNETVTELFERLLTQEGYQVEVAHDGAVALESITARKPDLVLLDVFIPGMNGFELCRTLKNNPSTRLLPVILVTGHHERENRIEGALAGADEFLSKPVDTQELVARVRSLVRLKRYTDDLESASSVIMMLAVMVEARDGYTAGHCHRMANYATALGRRVGLKDEQLQTLRRGGFLHDIGMLAIPDSVLRKRGALDPEEYELVKSHTVIGDTLCAHLPSLAPVRPIIRHHHERLDGSGYPDGLRGDAIPLVAQIIGLVDMYDALTTARAYQDPKPTDDIIDTLRQHVRSGWRSSELVEAFIALIQGGTLESFKVDNKVSWAPSPK
ncbi:MAG TPA: HD domain-containing phosphohydrolase [Vicinamibacterales bacterium]|nr:HD domain-containing phosphohydrolase [Vicinamibacterales bacterium]